MAVISDDEYSNMSGWWD